MNRSGRHTLAFQTLAWCDSLDRLIEQHEQHVRDLDATGDRIDRVLRDLKIVPADEIAGGCVMALRHFLADFRNEFGTRRLITETIAGCIAAVLIGTLLIGVAAITHEPTPAAVADPSTPALATDGADRGGRG